MQVKVGDKVIWRNGWGNHAPQPARITAIDLCNKEGEKYGVAVDCIYLQDLGRCCVSLDNGHWAYGYQIDTI